MPDAELDQLGRDLQDVSSPLEHPPDAVLEFLRGLELDEGDVEMLLGDGAGLSWADIRERADVFFAQLRLRVAHLVCNDVELRKEVETAVDVGLEASWLALLGVFGLQPSTMAGRALKPLAAAS